PAKKLGGESYLSWDFEKVEKEVLNYNPDVIIAHAYRHKHTTKVLKIAKKLNCKVFLVTHAPFVDKDSTRSLLAKLAVKFYDRFIGKKTINQFTKIIAIAKWEIPYLKKLGVSDKKIVYIPNGIPDQFFKQKIKPFKRRNIIFLGRISEVKNLQILIKAFNILNKKNKNLILEIIGPEEQPYAGSLKTLTEKLNLNVKFLPPIYNLNKKIRALQEADIFVLPSKREAMPQALIEAMSLGKIVISSRTRGGLEIISNGATGFLFDIGDEKGLSEIIEFCLNEKNKKLINTIKEKARKRSEEFKWGVLSKKLDKLIKEK
ncbi:MAG: glycosyltransferase family 4 protein, partial [Nanoarchaeota archaeon]